MRRGPFGRTRFARGGGASGFAHGQPYTITGSGFGVKPQAAPYFYDDFSGGTDGQTITGETGVVGTAPWACYVGAGGDPAIPTSYGYAAGQGRRGGMAFRKAWSGGSYWLPVVAGLGANAGYFSLWVKHHRVGPAGVGIHKWVRLQGTLSAGAPADYLYYGRPALDGSEIPGVNNYGIVVPANPMDILDWSAYGYDHNQVYGGNLTDNAWYRIEGYLDLGTQGVANGASFLRADGKEYGDFVNVPTYDASLAAGATVDHFAVGGVANDPDAAWTYWIDEAYFDSTLMRVELADATLNSSAAWNAAMGDIIPPAAHREVQRATAWSDTAITIVGNHGTFSPGGTGYLHVINAAGQSVACQAVALE
jgi:hypothetical protein